MHSDPKVGRGSLQAYDGSVSVESAVWCCTSCGAVYHKDFPRCPNDGAEVHLAQRDPLLDQSIGHYVIDRLVGEGGMGRVYAAHHATLPAKRYAIKVLLGDVAATSSMRRRFAKEAESASKLDHPNIVHVQDFGEMASGLPYIVMDYLDGVALTTLFEGCAMEPARVIRIARAVCEGLAYAHDAGVVHRDLKPDNIIVVIGSDGSEVPRIADFGLATTIDPDNASRITTTGMAMGTPAYAAPEQMAGKRVDRRADLYSLGMTMFEMLTGGKLPFEGHPMEMMTAKAHKEAPRLSEIAPTIAVPPGLEELIAQLIRRKYADRPASARQVMAALDRIAHGEAVVRPGAAVFRSGDADRHPPHQLAVTLGVRRKPRMWPGLMAAGLVLGGGLGWGYHRRDALRHFLQTARFAPAATVPEPAALERTAQAAATPRSESRPLKPAESVDPTAIEMDSQLASKQAPTAPVESQPTDSRPRKERRPTRAKSPAILGVRSEANVATPAGSPSQSQPVAVAPRSNPAVVLAPLPPKPVLVPEIATIDVTGALSRSSVRNAVERVMPALHQCVTSAPKTVRSHFTIDESRRAQNVRGPSECVVAALGGVRVDTVPDVGDAEVEVNIRFVAKP